jgi:hypothetical protein
MQVSRLVNPAMGLARARRPTAEQESPIRGRAAKFGVSHETIRTVLREPARAIMECQFV